MNLENKYHIPVLKKEVLEYLAPKAYGVYVDATFGGGGHTQAILEAEPTCKVIAFDWDTQALEKNGERLQLLFPGRLQLIWGNFSHIDKKLREIGIHSVDGILADFGTSQYQLAHKAGFSWNVDTELDMRMSPAHQKITAYEFINKADEEDLYYIFKTYGEEQKSRAIAKLIVDERKKTQIRTTGQLADLIKRVILPYERNIHPATKIFQALRIYVNKEIDNIHAFLRVAMRLLNNEGRLVCISFHSLEDREVKQFFQEEARNNPSVEILTKKVVTGSEEEIAQNPASRSAKLRALQVKR